MNKANSKFYKTLAEVFLQKKPEIIPIVDETLKTDLDFIPVEYVRKVAKQGGCNDEHIILLAYLFVNLFNDMKDYITKLITLSSGREINA